jgi:CheY-like chemotaxis protein
MRKNRLNLTARVILDVLTTSEDEAAENVSYSTRLVDVSPTGMQVVADEEITVDQYMSLNVMSRDAMFRLTGFPAWCRSDEEGGYLCGVTIDEEESDDYELWVQFCEELQGALERTDDDSSIIVPKTPLPLKLLYIEDDLTSQVLVSSVCSSYGNMEVTIANSGEDGLEYAGSEKFDMIIIDIKLPGMSGHEVAEKLRLVVPDVPLVAISSDLKNKVQARKSGFSEFVSKPIQLNTFLVTLADVYRRR